MRSQQDAIRAVELYSDMIKRICFYHLKNYADTEDVFQNVFLKYLLHEDAFESVEHERAWLIRVAINACKDHLKLLLRHKTIPLESLAQEAGSLDPGQKDVLEAVLSLPSQYKDVIYLHYYEGYNAAEIAGILGKRANTVYSLLSRGRRMLKEKLGGEEFDEPHP